MSSFRSAWMAPTAGSSRASSARPHGAGFRGRVVHLGEEVDVQLDPGGVRRPRHRFRVGGGQHDAGTGPQFVPVGDVDRDGGRDRLRAVVGDPSASFEARASSIRLGICPEDGRQPPDNLPARSSKNSRDHNSSSRRSGRNTRTSSTACLKSMFAKRSWRRSTRRSRVRGSPLPMARLAHPGVKVGRLGVDLLPTYQTKS